MRSLHSPLYLAPLAVPLTVAALAGCSSDSQDAPVLGNVSADGHCDREVISLVDGPRDPANLPDNGQDHLSVHYEGNDGAPTADVEARAVLKQPKSTDDSSGGAGFSTPGGTVTWTLAGNSRADIDHIEVTATTDNGTTETCTIDVA
jgi:hypothetical protein